MLFTNKEIHRFTLSHRPIGRADFLFKKSSLSAEITSSNIVQLRNCKVQFNERITHRILDIELNDSDDEETQIKARRERLAAARCL